MSTRIKKIIKVALVLALGPVVANATTPTSGTPVLGANGNYYEFVDTSSRLVVNRDWDTANGEANDLTFDGVVGHLATITSDAESTDIETLRQDWVTNHSGVDGELYVGGLQDPVTTDPDANWQWVNGEGPFPGNDGAPGYQNWQALEPNDSGVESHLAIAFFGADRRLWNDEGALGNIRGYVIEYDFASRFVPAGPGGEISDGGFTGVKAKYQNVLVGGNASINCCLVDDWRERAGDGKKYGNYLPDVFDLGVAIGSTAGCEALRPIPAMTAVLRPWQRGVPEIKEGEAGHMHATDHNIEVCLMQSDAVSQGVVFSEANTEDGLLGYAMDCSEPQIAYRPFTGAVALDPTEGDFPYVTRISADCDGARNAKKGSTNLFALNLWHYVKRINTKPYLTGLYDALLDSIEVERTRLPVCVDNTEGFIDDLESYVKAAKKYMGKKKTGPNKAVDNLNDATRLAMLIGSGPPHNIPVPTDPYSLAGTCAVTNAQGLWVGRLMALKFAVCSELQHKKTSSSSSDDPAACEIEPDIFAELPEL